MDIIAAIISERPYRKPGKLFDALELTKKMVGNQYPQEFKLIVFFFKTFFSKLNK
jgi:HD-GYP domain-containing protein (c-di-GMP phosphodiesterase class II)